MYGPMSRDTSFFKDDSTGERTIFFISQCAMKELHCDLQKPSCGFRDKVVVNGKILFQTQCSLISFLKS